MGSLARQIHTTLAGIAHGVPQRWNVSPMIRSLMIAALTFAGLGAYYQGARDSLSPERDGNPTHAQLERMARSSALFGVNLTKEALAERWIDQRFTGRRDGGSYRSVAIVRRHRGAIRAVGVAGGDGPRPTTYMIRVEAFRQQEPADGPASGYSVRISAPVEGIG